MRVALVFPPAGDPTRPHLDLPVVQAVLKRTGVAETLLLDANIRAYWHFADPARLELARARIADRLGALEVKSSLDSAEAGEYFEIGRAALTAPYVIRHVAEALAVLRQRDRFADFRQYAWSIRLLERALRLASAPYFPTRFVFDYKMALSTKSARDVVRATTDRKNLFLDYFAEAVAPLLLGKRPDLIVLAVALRSQLIPALTLARLLKQRAIGAHITAVGGFVGSYAHALAGFDGFHDLVDSFLVGPFRQYEGAFGEALAVARLASALAAGDALSSVPGILTRRPASGAILRTSPAPLATRVEEIPTPDFEGLAGERYLAPETVWPLALTKGCYWGKCTFCTRTEPYEERSADAIAGDIRALQQRHGARYFYFPDDGIAPRLLRSVAEKLAQEPRSIDWHSMARFDRQLDAETCRLLRRSGCRCLEFGLESAAPRILKLSRKGTTPSTVREVLEHCRSSGISARVFCIAGFPGETGEEARVTLDFLLESRHLISSVRVVRFMLEPDSYIALHPDEFGLALTEADPDRELSPNLFYEVEGGAGMKEALEIEASFRAALDEAYAGNSAFQTFRQHAFLHMVIHERPSLDYAARDAPAIAPERVLKAHLEPEPELSHGVLRYSLRRLSQVAAGQVVRRKREVLEARDHSALGAPDAQAAKPEGSPLHYLYVGEADLIHEVKAEVVKLLGMLDPSRALEETLRSRQVQDLPRAAALAQNLIRRRVVRVCPASRESP